MLSRAAALLACGWLSSGCAAAQAQIGSARWQPDDRVLITDFSMVRGLARSPIRIFAATDGGLIVFDELAGRFEPPLTVEDGYPAAPVSALAYDPRDATLWIASRGRRLFQFDARDRRLRDRQNLDGEATAIVPGTGGTDLFVRTERGWSRLDTFTRRVQPTTEREVSAAVRSNSDLRRREELLTDPGFQSLAGFLAGLSLPERVAITDVAATRDPGRYWVATAGGFIVDYDHFSRQWSSLDFGVLGQGMAGVLGVGDELYFVPVAPLRSRYGMARSTRDLQDWAVWDADSVRAMGRDVRVAIAVSSHDPVLWLGGREGLSSYHVAENRWIRVGRTLPSAEVTALAPATSPDGAGAIWVGTRRGAVLLGRDGESLGVTLLDGREILSLAQTVDRIWLGTGSGLFWVPLPVPSGAGAGPATPDGNSGALRRPVGALTTHADTVFAGLGEEVWRWSPGTVWQRVEAIGRVGGAVSALAVGSGGVWVGSSVGLVRWDLSDDSVDRLTFAAGDLPSGNRFRAIRSILPLDNVSAWVSIETGAFRVSMRF